MNKITYFLFFLFLVAAFDVAAQNDSRHNGDKSFSISGTLPDTVNLINTGCRE